MKKLELHSPDWFADAFRALTPMPEQLKNLATRLCTQYTIRGICDPMYIANVVAYELGIGDGQSSFQLTPVNANNKQIGDLVRRLKFSYSSCITGAETEVEAILREELGAPAGLAAALL